MSLLKVFWNFLNTRKKYWLLPVLFIIIFCLLVILIQEFGTRPFTYFID